MKNEQSVGDISNSRVMNVNTNNQSKNIDYYEVINKMEIFIHVVNPDFELSLEWGGNRGWWGLFLVGWERGL